MIVGQIDRWTASLVRSGAICGRHDVVVVVIGVDCILCVGSMLVGCCVLMFRRIVCVCVCVEASRRRGETIKRHRNNQTAEVVVVGMDIC